MKLHLHCNYSVHFIYLFDYYYYCLLFSSVRKWGFIVTYVHARVSETKKQRRIIEKSAPAELPGSIHLLSVVLYYAIWIFCDCKEVVLNTVFIVLFIKLSSCVCARKWWI